MGSMHLNTSRNLNRQQVADSQPISTELFLLGPGEKKVTEEVDPRVSSCSIFTFNREDHTLGNMIRSRLLRTPHVTFSGYKVPHPSVPHFLLRVQTDGDITPRDALVQACRDLVQDLAEFEKQFTKEFELHKVAKQGAAAAAAAAQQRAGPSGTATGPATTATGPATTTTTATATGTATGTGGAAAAAAAPASGGGPAGPSADVIMGEGA
ncbi:MAG: DNA-directed RNA polymerase II core subunit [Watsoniomyces obsoletus]|nr:MAG: DNA-directed RNA polymerase II core subunit [Watsoniomyces obsoletus]